MCLVYYLVVGKLCPLPAALPEQTMDESCAGVFCTIWYIFQSKTLELKSKVPTYEVKGDEQEVGTSRFCMEECPSSQD